MVLGIDVADVDDNRQADWMQAKTRGAVSFAFVRASQSTYVDKAFEDAWPKLRAAGITRGAYMFLEFPRKGVRVADPDKQAQTCIDTIGNLEKSDLPPALDVEFPNHGIAGTGMTADEALAWVRVAWRTLRSAYNTVPIIYTSGRVWHEELGDIVAPDLVESPLWLAHYACGEKQPPMNDTGISPPPVPRPWGDAWMIHQYQGDAVGFPGFSSTVDLNRFNLLKQDAQGDAVTWVQRKLRMTASGAFDAETVAKVRAFQNSQGLAADGVIGSKTFAALCWQSWA